jgi:hypothetical protein
MAEADQAALSLDPFPVAPAKAGVQGRGTAPTAPVNARPGLWMSAFAGVNKKRAEPGSVHPHTRLSDTYIW